MSEVIFSECKLQLVAGRYISCDLLKTVCLLSSVGGVSLKSLECANVTSETCTQSTQPYQSI